MGILIFKQRKVKTGKKNSLKEEMFFTVCVQPSQKMDKMVQASQKAS